MADNFPKQILPYLEGKTGELRITRFWSKVDIRGPNECWDWQAYCRGGGYGSFKLSSYNTVASNRMALICTTMREPVGMHVLHSCDRPSCCNPAHLRFGTPKENSDDKLKRARFKNGDQKGFNNPRCKLTPGELKVIVKRLNEGWGNSDIARDLPISHGLISRIRMGKAWKQEAADLGWSSW